MIRWMLLKGNLLSGLTGCSVTSLYSSRIGGLAAKSESKQAKSNASSFLALSPRLPDTASYSYCGPSCFKNSDQETPPRSVQRGVF